MQPMGQIWFAKPFIRPQRHWFCQ